MLDTELETYRNLSERIAQLAAQQTDIPSEARVVLAIAEQVRRQFPGMEDVVFMSIFETAVKACFGTNSSLDDCSPVCPSLHRLRTMK